MNKHKHNQNTNNKKKEKAGTSLTLLLLFLLLSPTLQLCGKNCISCTSSSSSSTCTLCSNNSKPISGECKEFTPSTPLEERCEIWASTTPTTPPFCKYCKPGYIKNEVENTCEIKWEFPKDEALIVPGCDTYFLDDGVLKCKRCVYSYPTYRQGKQVCRPFDFEYHKWCKYSFEKSCEICVNKKVMRGGYCVDYAQEGCFVLGDGGCQVCNWRLGYSMVDGVCQIVR